MKRFPSYTSVKQNVNGQTRDILRRSDDDARFLSSSTEGMDVDDDIESFGSTTPTEDEREVEHEVEVASSIGEFSTQNLESQHNNDGIETQEPEESYLSQRLDSQAIISPQLTPKPRSSSQPGPYVAKSCVSEAGWANTTPSAPPPSILASFFSHNCERYLKLATSRETCSDVSESDIAVRKARTNRGVKFESKLLKQLSSSSWFTVVNLTNKGMEFVNKTLENLKGGEVLYQLPLQFSENSEAAKKWQVKLTNACPDFIFVDKGYGDSLNMIIVDAKSSVRVKFEHQIQVAFYGLLLEDYLKSHIESKRLERKLPPLHVSKIAGVWLPDNKKVQWVDDRRQTLEMAPRTLEMAPEIEDISIVKKGLDNFLRGELNQILQKDLGDATWRLSDKCRTCPYVGGCRKEATEGKLVTQLPYLSCSDLHWMEVILRSSSRSSRQNPSSVKLQDIENLLNKQPSLTSTQTTRLHLALGVDDDLSSGEGDTRSAYSRALTNRSGVIVRPGRNLGHFPSREDFRIFLSLHCDPRAVTPSPYAWLIRVEGRKKEGCHTCDTHHHIQEYTLSPIPSEYRASEKKLIEKLYEVLENFSKDGEEELHRACVFFYNGLEQRQLENVILRSCSSNDFDIRKKAMACGLTLMEGGDAVDLNKAPDKTGKARKAGDIAPKLADWSQGLSKLKKDDLKKRCEDHLPKKLPGSPTKDQLMAALRLEAKRLSVESFEGLPLEAEASESEIEERYKKMEDSIETKKLKRMRKLVEPRTALIEETIKWHLVFRTPGFYDFPSLCEVMNCCEPGQLPVNHEDIFLRWEEEKCWEEKKRLIEACMQQRVSQLAKMVTGFRQKLLDGSKDITEELRPKFLHEACEFSLVKPLWKDDTLLSRMAFFTQHEALTNCAEIRRNRCLKPLAEQLLEGSSLKVAFEGGELQDAYQKYDDGTIKKREKTNLVCTMRGKRVGTFWLHEDSIQISLQRDRHQFCEWILVPKEHAHMARDFDDLTYQKTEIHETFSLASIDAVEDGGKLTIMMTPPWPKPSDRGKEYILFKRYTNRAELVDTMLRELKRIDEQKRTEQKDPTFLELIKKPHALNEAPNFLLVGKENDSKSSIDACLNDELQCLCNSQREALKGTLSRRLTTLWGPPGSGKTYFIASLIAAIALLRNKTSRKNICILITANTNSAIETCLDQICDRIKNLKDPSCNEAGVWKLMGSNEAPDKLEKQGHKFEFLKPGDFNEEFLDPSRGEKRVFIIGSTIWKLARCGIAKDNCAAFDLVVVDEGSQMPVCQASLAVRFLKDDGLLVVAGDVLQLPPIVKGTYPPPEPGDPNISGSILEVLLRDMSEVQSFTPFSHSGGIKASSEHDYQEKLKENFRMNESLARFTQLTYGNDYESLNPDERLSLKGTTGDLEYEAEALHANASLNIIRFNVSPPDVVQSMSREDMASLEASHVCKVLKEWQKSCDADDIWERCIVVTPHHVQRRAIRRALNELNFGNMERLLVDTVEKAQGKTADLVIVCYGLLGEREQLERDMPFLMNHSRLNVALSRARCKIIMFVGEEMCSLPLKCLAVKEAQIGYLLFDHALAHSDKEGAMWKSDISLEKSDELDELPSWKPDTAPCCHFASQESSLFGSQPTLRQR